MKAYSFDDNGVYSGESVCQPSPLEPGVFLIPANATTQKPPNAQPPQVARYNGSGWEIVCESPTLDKDIIDLLDVVDEATKQVVGKRAVVNETKRQAKIAKEKADEVKRGQEQSKAQAELKLTTEKLEALWDAVALNDMGKLNALKAKLK